MRVYDRQFQDPLARLREAASLALMVMAAWTVVRLLAVRLLEEGLSIRAQRPTRCVDGCTKPRINGEQALQKATT